MYRLIRRAAFMMDAESSHDVAHRVLRIVGSSSLLRRTWQRHITGDVPVIDTTVFGLPVPNPIGLAAGFDKNAHNIHALTAFGFGWLELGTVTPRPQPGNDRPRLFRVPEFEGIINRNGFNNAGLDKFVTNVQQFRADEAAGKVPRTILGVNIGKNTATAVDDAVADYLACLETVYPLADYIIVNISSPNSPGLRDLQHVDALANLLSQLKTRQGALTTEYGTHRPLAVKLAPDLRDSDIKGIANVIADTGIEGVVATNTTVQRDTIKGHHHERQGGGLSGRPLNALSLHICQQLRDALPSDVPLVACGGIDSATGVAERLSMGCTAVQLYSAMIYRGPGLIGTLVRDLKTS